MKTTSEVNTNTIEITRRSKVGWGWKIWTYDRPEPPATPDYTGTPRQVLNKIYHDRLFQSALSGGVWHNEQWFAKVDNRWAPIKFEFSDTMSSLFWRRDDGGYVYDSVTATAESLDK